MDIIEKINHIDLAKLEQKTVKFVVGFLFGSFFLVMANKFINDNYTFRIRRISNLPDPVAKPEK